MVCVVPLLGRESILADITRQPSFEARSVTLGVLMGSIKSYFVVTRGSWRFHVPGCSVPSTTCRMDATSSKRLQLSRYVLQGQVPHLVCCLNCDSGMLACGSCWLCLKHGQSHACFEHELNGKPTLCTGSVFRNKAMFALEIHTRQAALALSSARRNTTASSRTRCRQGPGVSSLLGCDRRKLTLSS